MRAQIEFRADLSTDSRIVAKLFGIPHTVLSAWQLEGYIDRASITQHQWNFLNMIRCCIWDNRRVIRAMLAGLPKSERRRLVDSCEKTTIERIVYLDFLRLKLVGRGIMNDGRLITFTHYQRYLTWRHPNLHHLLTRRVFDKQRKAAEARIRYVKHHGSLDQFISDLGLRRLANGQIVNPNIKEAVAPMSSAVFFDRD